jgi:hypothetical protein
MQTMIPQLKSREEYVQMCKELVRLLNSPVIPCDTTLRLIESLLRCYENAHQEELTQEGRNL